MVQSIGQSIPTGGMTATQPVQPTGQATPADIMAAVEALTPIQARFRQQSTFLHTSLPQASFTAVGLGQDVPVQISNVGLAIRLITEWNVVIEVQNSATNAAVFSVSPLFPYNLIANTSIQVNGGAAIYNVSGPSGLSLTTRARRGARKLTGQQTGWNAALGNALDPSLFPTQTYGSNLTPTNTGAKVASLSGVASVSVAGSAGAGANSRITLRFITVERIVLDHDSLLGAPPLQNNQTFVQVTRRLVGALKGTRDDRLMPFYSAASSLTPTLISATADTTYEFASVPADAALYQALVTNSFQSQEQKSFVVSSTGAEAWSYAIPTNNYLVALHNLAVDGNGAALVGYDDANGLGLLKLVYAGATILPVKESPWRDRAMSYLVHDYDPETIPGLRLWDGEATSDDITASDNMGWLDAYNTSQPTELIDVGTSAVTNITANITRESVVVGNVQQVGGGA